MAQVLIRHYSMDPLVHALASNTRHRPLIRDMLDDSGELAIKIGSACRDHRKCLAGVPQREADRVFFDRQCIVYTANEGNQKRGGFAVLRGELVGLHHIDKGKGDWLMRAAIEAGARKLCCLGTPYLLNFYSSHGFNTVRVERNTDGPNGPDCHYMERTA